jgi:hypothetical protein
LTALPRPAHHPFLRRLALALLGASLATGLTLGCSGPDKRPTSKKSWRTEPTKKRPKKPHASSNGSSASASARPPGHDGHQHPHPHPHGPSDHHHHPHPHPHLSGPDGHHHPY